MNAIYQMTLFMKQGMNVLLEYSNSKLPIIFDIRCQRYLDRNDVCMIN